MTVTWAYDVFHYQHLLNAAQASGLTGVAMLPWAPSETLAKISRSWPASRTPLSRLNRRSRPQLPAGVRFDSFGATQLLPPLAGALGRDLPTRAKLLVRRRAAQKVASVASGSSLLHGTEGLLLEAMTRSVTARVLVERRSMHQADFDAPIDPLGDFPFEPATPNREMADLTDQEMLAADKILVYSSVAADSYARHGVPREKLAVSPLGTSEVPANPDNRRQPDPHSVLFIGRASAVKGLDLAAAAVRELGRPYRLHVAGHASSQVREWLSRQPHIRYEGVVSRDRLRELAKQSPILLAPSMESFGLAALDAAANGAFVLGLETTGLRDWLPAESGQFLPDRDPTAWAEAVASVLQRGEALDPGARYQSGMQASAIDWRNAGAHLSTVYEGLLQR